MRFPILVLQFFFTVGFCFLMLLSAYSRADQSSLCVDVKDAKIIGAFYHSKNTTGKPDYCEYHFFKMKPLEKLVTDSDARESDSLQKNTNMDDQDNNTVAHETDKKIDYHVKYLDLEGNAFAQKELKFSSGLTTPSVNQLDLRSGERRYAAPLDGDVWQVRYRKSEDKKEKTWDLKYQDMDVNDAGFVRKVRQSWNRLSKGESVKFNFLSVVHGKPLKMSARKMASSDCDLPSERDEKDFTCIKVSISNYFIRLIAPALWLSFDNESDQLLVFKGIVNLKDGEGENQTGIIYYRYL